MGLLIVSPTRLEQQVLRAALGPEAEVHCCGPGPHAVTRWCDERLAPLEHDRRPLVLAGLAGGLSAHARAGQAYAVSEVRDAHGARVALAPVVAARSARIVASIESILTTPAAKAALAATSGADLVDLESAAFARAAARWGGRWAIVRGVSDGLQDALPEGIDGWIDSAGRIRTQAVAAALARRPQMLLDLARLRRRSLAALRAIPRVVRELPLEE